jgi:hypothetical protein
MLSAKIKEYFGVVEFAIIPMGPFASSSQATASTKL